MALDWAGLSRRQSYDVVANYTFARLTRQQRYSSNPLTLFRIIRHCLNTEMKLVQQVENAGVGRTGILPAGECQPAVASQLFISAKSKFKILC